MQQSTTLPSAARANALPNRLCRHRPRVSPRHQRRVGCRDSSIPITLTVAATEAAAAADFEVAQTNGSSPEFSLAANGDSGNGIAVAISDAVVAAGEANLFEAAADAAGEPYTLVKKRTLAGGVLDLVRLEGDRILRIWMPPGYSKVEAARHPYPLLILNDGQNLFDDALSFSGSSWKAGETAAKLISSGKLPPFLVVGIDHAGPNRSLEYLPVVPGTGPGGFRQDAAEWPGGEVAAYMDRVVNEIMPWIAQSYGTSTNPEHIAFGGSSFGGICALWASMHYPEKFGAVLVESPSLWIDEEKFFREEVANYTGPWPQRMFLAMGSQEYSGIRKTPGPQWDKLLVNYCTELAGILEERGLDSSRLKWLVSEGATHTEAAWAKRLPQALSFLLQPWWSTIEARYSEALFFTSPRKLQAGQPAVLFVNKAKSIILSGATAPLTANIGFNNWTQPLGQLQLQPAPQLQQQSNGSNGSSGETKWQSVSFTIPADAYEMHFALTDGYSWDNNAGFDFYARVKQPGATLTSGRLSPEAAAAAAKAAAEGPGDEVASRSGSKLFFTTPEVLVAGAPARLYFNRARSWALRNNPNVKIHMGYNHWECNIQDLQLAPSSLWRSHDTDWWSTEAFEVPKNAFDVSFAFTDGHGTWESNDGHNFSVPVWQPAQQQEAAPRAIASMDSFDHAGGRLHIINLTRRAVVDKQTKESRWKEEKVLRVWTPPGYSKENAPPGGWPILYMNDGQNMFEDWIAHQGHAWNVGYCAAGLIANGTVPPFIVAAVDSAGPMRSLNYLPYKPGTGVGGFRGDAERWPGGGCEGYMRRLVQELVPLVQEEFNTATDPAKVAFGGGSFAGVTALYAALHYPHVFGSVLAESPSLWIAEGRFLQDMWDYRGPLPERLFLGCGTKEYSATRDHVREEIDALLLHDYQEAARALDAAGMRGSQRLYFQVEEDAGHHELAWSWRLSGALSYLLSPWWDE